MPGVGQSWPGSIHSIPGYTAMRAASQKILWGTMAKVSSMCCSSRRPKHKHHSRVRIFDKLGKVACDIGTADSSAPGSFFSVHALCIDYQKNLYVGEVNLTITFGVIYLLNKILMIFWRQ
jgi:hypothetical protein